MSKLNYRHTLTSFWNSLRDGRSKQTHGGTIERDRNMTSALNANKLPLNRKMETSFTCREKTNLIMLYTGKFLKEHMVVKTILLFSFDFGK